jgi:hypothetical protein
MGVTHGYQPGVLPTELDPLAVLSEEADCYPLAWMRGHAVADRQHSTLTSLVARGVTDHI